MAHTQCRTASPEVGDLEVFVNRAAGAGNHGTVAHHIAPGIESAAIIDIDPAGAVQLNQTILAGDIACTASAWGFILTAHTDSPVYVQCGPIRQHQGAIYILRVRHITAIESCRSSGIAGLCRIERNQQSDARGNGVLPGEGGLLAVQGDLRLAVVLGVGGCIAQIIKNLSAGFKKTGVLGNKPGGNRAAVLEFQRHCCIRCNARAGIHVVPSPEDISRRRGRHQPIGIQGTLGVYVVLRNRLTIHGIAAVFTGREGNGSLHIHHQRDITQGDAGSRIGAAGLDIDFYAAAGGKLFGEGSTGRGGIAVHLDGAAVHRHSVVKRENSRGGFPIGDRQRGIVVCITTTSTFTLR